jgi:hypothetical protein
VDFPFGTLHVPAEPFLWKFLICISPHAPHLSGGLWNGGEILLETVSELNSCKYKNKK